MNAHLSPRILRTHSTQHLLAKRELFKSEINDNYLSENARINNLQEVTLKLYLKDTPGQITASDRCPSGSRVSCCLSLSLLPVGFHLGTLGACDAPLKIKSSLIMQIIHLLYFQHNTNSHGSYKRHNLLSGSLCQRRIVGLKDGALFPTLSK